jgi:hypothetical protein
MPEPHLRAADADRSAVADVLGASLSTGRLSVAEYDERLTRAWSARTYGELTELTADLPPAPAATQPATRPAAAPAACGPWWAHGWNGGLGVPAGGDSLRAAWAGWASTAAIVVAIWLVSLLATGGWVYPWPVWVIGPWGAVLLARTLGGDREGAAAPGARPRIRQG